MAVSMRTNRINRKGKPAPTQKPKAYTVQVDGYRLIIKDGAMAGLAYDEFPWPWGDARYDEVTVVDSWSGWMAAGPYILGRDGL